jgi:uncharacterized protein YbbC (DUF1343 family)
MRVIFFLICSIILPFFAQAESIINGDARFELYESQISNKRVAVFANNSSQVNGQNIVDFLSKKQINIVKVFTPEHGFNVEADAGSAVNNQNSADSKPKIVSLYGKKDKPTKNDLADVDVIIFDIQDVGVRYYTYISSLQRIMEAVSEYNKPLIILDRANPNGFYIDGPILEPKYKSFVGMQAIPIVYGMTIGEYARMLVGEEWLDLSPKNKSQQLKLTIIPVANYTHASKYQLTDKPSPNLPNMTAIYLYPSLGWFEGTQLSIGRGTSTPFQVIGHPDYKTDFSFTPHPMSGATNPPFNGKLCYGWDLQMSANDALEQVNGRINLEYLLRAYKEFPDKAHFFTNFFDKLAGNDSLKQQIIAGKTESEIRSSWQPGLKKFATIRNKYLLYPENDE